MACAHEGDVGRAKKLVDVAVEAGADAVQYELVDPDDPGRQVGYGETGRVMLTTLTREFFMPRFLERDEGERAEPIELYPWDGVRDLRPFSRLAGTVNLGVY